MSFETEVELSLTVPRRELRSARQEIESGLGSVNTGASAAGGAGGGGGSRSRNRRLFRWARQRTQSLESIVTILENMDEGMGGGGGGDLLGGGGTFISRAASAAAGVSAVGLAKRFGTAAAARLATSLSGTTLGVGTLAVGTMAATKFVAEDMQRDPPEPTDLPPFARRQLTENVGTTTPSGAPAGGITSAQIEQMMARRFPNIGEGGGGRAGGVTSADIENLVNTITERQQANVELNNQFDITAEVDQALDEVQRDVQDEIENVRQDILRATSDRSFGL